MDYGICDGCGKTVLLGVLAPTLRVFLDTGSFFGLPSFGHLNGGIKQ
jgi:hypothetical protein